MIWLARLVPDIASVLASVLHPVFRDADENPKYKEAERETDDAERETDGNTGLGIKVKR